MALLTQPNVSDMPATAKAESKQSVTVNQVIYFTFFDKFISWTDLYDESSFEKKENDCELLDKTG